MSFLYKFYSIFETIIYPYINTTFIRVDILNMTSHIKKQINK